MVFSGLKNRSKADVRSDLMAGITGGIIGLPQVMAYAMIAGMPPETGLYGAIIITVIAALLGSSWHMITGPAAAISIVILSIVSPLASVGSDQYLEWVLLLTLMVGLIQLLFGVFKIGALVNFISHTVIIGFTTGAAVLIGVSQLKYILAVKVPSDATFIETIAALFNQLDRVDELAVAIGVITCISACFFKTLNRWVRFRVPHLLLGLIVGSTAGYLLDGHHKGIAMLGALPSGVPLPSFPSISFESFHTLLPGAFALALLGLIEAVSIARAIAMRSHQQIDGNREFIGQGVANAVGSLFSCFAGSGSFTRSGANYDAGAKTPLSAVFSAVSVVLIMGLIPDVTRWLPLPAMAGVIVLIAWNLIDVKHIKAIVKVSRQEAAVLIATFVSTLVFGPVMSIYIGVLLSIVLYLRRTSKPSVIPVAPLQHRSRRSLRNVNRNRLPECPQLKMVRIDGSLFFGCVNHIQSTLRLAASQIKGRPNLLIVGKGINFMDVSSVDMLGQEAKTIKGQGGRVMMTSMKGILMDDLYQSGLIKHMDSIQFFDSTEEALSCVVPTLDRSICATCTHPIFKECPSIERAEILPVRVNLEANVEG